MAWVLTSLDALNFHSAPVRLHDNSEKLPSIDRAGTDDGLRLEYCHWGQETTSRARSAGAPVTRASRSTHYCVRSSRLTP